MNINHQNHIKSISANHQFFIIALYVYCLKGHFIISGSICSGFLTVRNNIYCLNKLFLILSSIYLNLLTIRKNIYWLKNIFFISGSINSGFPFILKYIYCLEQQNKDLSSKIHKSQFSITDV